MIYLDNNATTPILGEVVDAMVPYLRDHFGNPSSGHALGRRASRGVEEARAQVAGLIGCEVDEIVFTSGGTEANNLAIRGVMEAGEYQGGVVTSVIEHPATERPCAWMAKHHGVVVERVGVDGDGRVLVEDAARVLGEGTALVTVMHANNETGVLQPIAELSKLARAAGALVHTDAAQSVGKVAVCVNELGVDLLTIAGHKFYAPKGVGALYIRRGVAVAPFALGAGHEGGLRPGTENVASIVGIGVAAAIARREMDELGARMLGLRELLWGRLSAAIPGLAINGHVELRLPNTLNIRFPGVSGDAVLAGAPEIAASTGSACDAGETAASKVILAMGVPAEEALGSVRLSLGRGTREEDVERAAQVLIGVWERIGG